MATQDSSAVIKYLAELVSRLFSKTPVFFKVIQVLSIVATVVTGLPAILESVGITLPSALTALESKVVAIAGLVSLFISSLPVVTTTPDSTPFTASKDTK